MKVLRTICTLLFSVAVLLFLGLAYPHHLHYQEQYQLFLFDSTYAWDIIKLPGGIADLLGRFCTQFFLYAWVGALIIAILLSVVQLLTLRLFIDHLHLPLTIDHSATQKKNIQRSIPNRQGSIVKAQWAYGLSFVPSFLLWLFLLDENALLGGVWAVLLTLFVSWVFDLLHDGWLRRMLLIAAVPALYWMAGPVCIVFFLLQAIRTNEAKWANAWHYGVILLLAVMPRLLASHISVPADRLWFGIHYHRYPMAFPTLLWAACLSVVVITLIVRVVNKRTKPSPSSFAFHLSSFLLVAIIMGYLVWNNSNFKAERVMRYDFMARFQQWNRILETINAEKPNNQIGVTVQNLALGMHGMLADHLFEYNQNGLLGLLPDVGTDAISPLPTAEAFYQLGMITVAQRTVFEAQEAILDFQKSARCYKRLAQTNLILGNYEVARKYLTTLQKTLYYREWANETLPLLGNEEAIAKHPEYGRLRQYTYDDDFFFGDHVTAEMLERLYFTRSTSDSLQSKNNDNRLALEYLKAYYMLTGDRENYAKLLLQLK